MARYAQVFEASGGGVSGLEARLAAVLADPPVVFEEIAPLPDCPVLVQFVSLAEDAVVQALAVLGVPAGECDLLTDLAQACASVARRGAPAPDEEFFTRTGPATGRGAAGLDLAGAAEAAPAKSGAAGPRVTEPTEADPAGTADPDPTDPAPADPATGEVSVGEEAPAVKGRASSLVDALGVLSRAAGRLDRVMISGTRELTAAQGKLLLADKGVTDLDELTPAQKDAWRANAKRRTRTDLEFEMGWGAGEIRDLVALAGMPATTTGPVGSALATGEASWRLVRGFVGAAGHLPTHLAGGVANALFGTDESVAATERLTSDREFTGRPWAHREFYRALDREVAKAEANLDEDERRTKSRQKSLAGTDTWGRMDEDGTGTFGMRCTASQVAAILDRVEGAARRARSNGDGRSLGQIRSAVATTLLLKGTVALPDLPEDPGLITPEQTEQLAAILAGLPAAVLNVIVPLNHLHPDGDGGSDCAGGEADEPTVPTTDQTDETDDPAGEDAGGQDLAHDPEDDTPDAGPGSAPPTSGGDRGEDSAPPGPDAARGEGSAPRGG